MIKIFIVILWCLNVVKAFHDKHIDSVKDKHDRRMWHSLYLVHHVIMIIGFLAIINPHFFIWIIAFPFAASLRVIFFNTILNLLRDKPLLYLGSEGIDGTFKGKEGLYYALALTVLATTTFILWTA